ncbi:MAG: hypothetical protein K2Y01_00095 [Rhabdochlamydiaceae bacterium]|nr:hypothetical protein [Rhabdochlamydiaceae bacterium]
MPTSYMNVTEDRAIEEFKKKIEQEEGVLSIEKPEPPDILIKTRKNRIIWGDVTSAFRTKELAKFLNKHGLYNPGEPATEKVFPEHFDNYPTYISQLKEEIKTRIAIKDSKKSYESIVSQHGKGTLILYIDDPLFSPGDLQHLLANNASFLPKLEKFESVYLYVPTSYSIGFGKKEVQKIGGLHLLE